MNRLKLGSALALNGAPSVLFDAIVLAMSETGAVRLAREAAAVDFVRDAFGHLKVVGFTAAAGELLAKAPASMSTLTIAGS